MIRPVPVFGSEDAVSDEVMTDEDTQLVITSAQLLANDIDVDGDALVISTPGTTFKRASLDRDPRMTLCVISNAEPTPVNERRITS